MEQKCPKCGQTGKWMAAFTDSSADVYVICPSCGKRILISEPSKTLHDEEVVGPPA